MCLCGLRCAFVELLRIYCVFAVNIYVLFMYCVIIDRSVHSCMINILQLSGSVMVWSKVIVLNDWTVFELIFNYHNAWKVSVFGVILVRIFPHSDWTPRIQTECGKIRTRITPNTDTSLRSVTNTLLLALFDVH